ncbi:Inherit from bactNOG: O-methyltransferase [Seminavis robusta]|uniref:Inherit from bactNOG: O-methyltransferase n=1 Tax=Seminavis robusta TaxID=568900 RepID=A0A9N8EQF4_9STRA|nr:Inherit from bactNOG: O-methyltransferase [Seminavis robusta]|eukprot:Sro1342_g264550.1 Inherit from bactNOG: O-methyltransferase (357) ;mRNA; r:11451-12622
MTTMTMERSSLSSSDRLYSLRDLLTGVVAGFSFLFIVAYVDETFLRPAHADLQDVVVGHRWLQQQQAEEALDFRVIATRTGTDKVWGVNAWDKCKHAPETCGNKPQVENPKCRVLQGHFYHTIYNKWLAEYSSKDAEPFQFLEIGFFNGRGFDAYREFLPNAETHSIEIACLPVGPQNEGKWPFGNFAAANPRYQEYLDTNQLHCGDGSKFDYLQEVWTTQMRRPDAPPLKVVVEDASHLAKHMAQSLFFWFPRIAPGGILVVEDVQPINEANLFRTNTLPQVLKDLHYCGGPADKHMKDKACFPTIWPLLHSVHCEMHICVLERNQHPAMEYSKEESVNPPHALQAGKCLFHSSD